MASVLFFAIMITSFCLGFCVFSLFNSNKRRFEILEQRLYIYLSPLFLLTREIKDVINGRIEKRFLIAEGKNDLYTIILDKETQKSISISRIPLKYKNEYYEIAEKEYFYDFSGKEFKLDDNLHSRYCFISGIRYDDEMVKKIISKIIEEGHSIQNLEYIYKIKFVDDDLRLVIK